MTLVSVLQKEELAIFSVKLTTKRSSVLKKIINVDIFEMHGIIKGPFSGLRQFLATESPVKMMKNTFYFLLQVLFVFNIFKILS